jgi:ketosteroid isomerase-like protein
MRGHIALGSAGFLLLFAGCKQPGADLTAAEVDAVKANYTDWAKAAPNRQDSAAAAKLLAEDVWVSTANQAPVVGRPAMLAVLKTWPADLKQSWNVEEVVGSGDHAFSRASVTETFTQAGKPGSFHEVCASLHRRSAAGDWQFSRVICHPVDTLPSAPKS